MPSTDRRRGSEAAIDLGGLDIYADGCADLVRTTERNGGAYIGPSWRVSRTAPPQRSLRSDEEAQAAIDRLQEGEGLDDLVQDLRDLAAFVKEHKAELARIGVRATSGQRKRRSSRPRSRTSSPSGERATPRSEARSSCATAPRRTSWRRCAKWCRRRLCLPHQAGDRRPVRGTYSAQDRARARSRAKSAGTTAPSPTNGQPQV